MKKKNRKLWRSLQPTASASSSPVTCCAPAYQVFVTFVSRICHLCLDKYLPKSIGPVFGISCCAPAYQVSDILRLHFAPHCNVLQVRDGVCVRGDVHHGRDDCHGDWHVASSPLHPLCSLALPCLSPWRAGVSWGRTSAHIPKPFLLRCQVRPWQLDWKIWYHSSVLWQLWKLARQIESH